ncbi:MAG: LptF/LptG family permease [Planctomycetota bacterium]|jgi:lipopolysaccharide export system permease protein
MISTIDRYIFRALVTNYVIAVAVMVSLYVTLDMFVNMDEFTEQGYPLATVLGNIFSYYWPNVFLYFSQLSGAITLFSCMAALARMRRLNELTAVLASGVSLYRIARPIVIFGISTSALLVVDTEVIIPAVAHLLARDHDDADGKRAYEVLFLKDRGDALFSANEFHPRTRELKRVLVLVRDEKGAVSETIEADSATWEPPLVKGEPGRWLLNRGQHMRRTVEDGGILGPQANVDISLVRYYESDLGPEQILLRQAEGWIQYLSLSQLKQLQQSRHADRPTVLRAKHQRVTAPIMSMVLLLLGLPFFLDRSPSNVLSDTGKCLVACGSLFVTNFVGQSMRPEIDSALMAWLPIFIFTTVAMVLIDRIRT